MKNEFDDILKKRSEEIYYPVDAQHRQEMIHLLHQHKRRKGGFFWWFGGMLLTIAIAGMFIALNGEIAETDQQVPLNESSNSQSIMDRAMIQPAGDPTTLLTDRTPVINKSTVSGKSISSNTISPTDKGIINFITENKVPNTGQTQKAIANSQDLNHLKVNESLSENTSLQSGSSAITEEVETFEGNLGQQIGLEPEVENLSGVNLSKQQRLTTITLPLEKSIISSITNSNEIWAMNIKPAFKVTHPIAVFAETGISFIPPSFPDVKSGWSLKTGGGASCSVFGKTQLTWSAGYLFQKEGFAFERTSTVDQPGFGSRSSFHRLTPDKLHFLYSNLGLQQRIKRHILSAGIGAQWLYGAQGTIVIQTKDQFSLLSTETSTRAWLNLDGMQRLIWNGQISYGYQLTPKISLQLGAKYNFTSFRADDSELAADGYYWKGKFATINPSFTINYRFYGK